MRARVDAVCIIFSFLNSLSGLMELASQDC